MPINTTPKNTNQNTRVGRLTELSLNNCIAKILRTMHPEWAKNGCIRSEEINVIEGKPNARPDILVNPSKGVPVVIETELTPARSVVKDAESRLGLRLIGEPDHIEQSIAVKIPKHLANIEATKIEKYILDAEFEFCQFSLNKEELEYSHRWPRTGWITGNLFDLADLIDLSTLSENILNLGLNVLKEKVSGAAKILRQNCSNRQNILDKIADSLNQKDSEQTTCMAMSIVLNAIMFHKSLEKSGKTKIKTFEEIWKPENENLYYKEPLIEHWTYIVNNINYLPIFKIAMKILEPLSNKDCKVILSQLFEGAHRLEELGTVSRHDLCGRLFQQLIIDRKFLATFYTLPSSAALLAELAVDRLNVDWRSSQEIKTIKVADFACGTGALLSATMHSILSKHNRSSGKDSVNVHKHLVEDVLIGADIMPAATHLTASMISGVFPENSFNKTSIYTLPYGDFSDDPHVRSVSLGSLELLGDEPLLSIFDTGERGVATIEGYDTKANLSEHVTDNSCELVIMNPPYARPCGQEADKVGIPVPCFKGMNNSDEETRLMMKRLGNLRKNDMVGDGRAGLGSDFFDIAHKKVKLDGVIALILPETFVGGKAWSKMRQCIAENYTNIVIFTIVASGQYNRSFSADTSMGEILIIATRNKNGEKQPVRYVNLKHRPGKIAEAVLIAKKVIREPNTTRITLGNDVVAEILIWDQLDNLAGIKHCDTARAAHGISVSEIILPHLKQPIPIPITKLSSLGKTGLYHMKFNNTAKDRDGIPKGPFDIIMPPINKFPAYPSLWNHHAPDEKKLIVKPDSEGRIRENCEDKAEEFWDESKSKLHFNRDFRLNAQPLAACMTERHTIGGRAWPNVLLNNADWDIPVLLWANTTLGLISFWKTGTRQQQGRSNISISLLLELPVLDVRELSQSQLETAKEIFESFKKKEFKPANEAYQDTTRKELDEAILVDLLGLPKKIVGENHLELLRLQWCDEPTVHGGKSTRPKNGANC